MIETMIESKNIVVGSFRDPSGFLFSRNGILYRQINKEYQEHYELAVCSGLFDKLIAKKMLIPYEDCDIQPEKPEIAYKIIKPLKIPFISYPYEWCFSQLKQAALLTLKIQITAFKSGMTLKDASAYNVQFLNGKPIFIDTLSFEKYDEGSGWIAYRQFCQHFLAPLALMQFTDIRLNQLLRIYIDGIPLDLASTLLPAKSWINTGILLHIHLHAKSEKKYETVHEAYAPLKKLNKNEILGLLDSLETTIKKLEWEPRDTEWIDYYQDMNYSRESFEKKKEIVNHILELIHPITVWDLGANTGIFSRLAAKRGIAIISCDMDPACVERNYRNLVKDNESNILPLLIDLTNPSPGIGWENNERESLLERGPTDTVLALALLHHLVISNNLPFERVAGFFSEICKNLIIEFVPKTDSQVQVMLLNRQDIFPDYTQDNFEKAFLRFFMLAQKEQIPESQRIIYLWQRREAPL